MIAVQDDGKTKEYLYVSATLYNTSGYPVLCTFTVDGEFGFVFCDRSVLTHPQGVAYQHAIQYITDTNPGVIRMLRFWT